MDRWGKDTPRPRTDACHGGRCGGESWGKNPATGPKTARHRSVRNRRGSSGSHAAGKRDRRSGQGAEPLAGRISRRALGARPAASTQRCAQARFRRGVRIAKDYVNSGPDGAACEGLNHSASAAHVPVGRRSGERCSIPKAFPGTGTAPPGFSANETLESQTTVPVLISRTAPVNTRQRTRTQVDTNVHESLTINMP